MMKEEFLGYLRLERNYSQSTVDNYGRALRSLKDYFETLEEPLSWLTIDSDIVRGWIGQLMDAGESPSTVNLKLSAVRAFYRWALRRGLGRSRSCQHDPRSKETAPLAKLCPR